MTLKDFQTKSFWSLELHIDRYQRNPGVGNQAGQVECELYNFKEVLEDTVNSIVTVSVKAWDIEIVMEKWGVPKDLWT